MSRKILQNLALGVALSTAGCGGTGTVNVSLWGEEYIADRIPAAMGDQPGFENGWSLQFQRFLINVGNFTVESSVTMPRAGGIDGFRVFDLRQTAMPASMGTIAMAAAQRWDRIAYEVAPANAQTVAGNATAGDVQLMQSMGYSVYVEATAMHATMGNYTLRWGFNTSTRYHSCEDSQAQRGLVVPTGGNAEAQITIHGDHLFYDDLQAPDARLRLDAIVGADRNMDRVVTLDEMATVDLTTLPTGQYGTGSAPNVRNLREFVTALIHTVGHFNGEGHCAEERR